MLTFWQILCFQWRSNQVHLAFRSWFQALCWCNSQHPNKFPNAQTALILGWVCKITGWLSDLNLISFASSCAELKKKKKSKRSESGWIMTLENKMENTDNLNITDRIMCLLALGWKWCLKTHLTPLNNLVAQHLVCVAGLSTKKCGCDFKSLIPSGVSYRK